MARIVCYVNRIYKVLNSNHFLMNLDVQKVSSIGAKYQTYLITAESSALHLEKTLPLKDMLNFFDPSYLKQQNLINKTARGRGEVYFFTLDNLNVVLRHYYRGGMIAKLIEDRFVFAGIQNTRAYRELAILQYLHTKGVNVPTPISARVHVLGLSYQCDIITEAVERAKELHGLLLSEDVDNATWTNIGHEVQNLHRAQACHYDLNVKNVLITEQGKVVLLDFDSCEIRPGETWKQKNIDRFKRSLLKQASKFEQYHFDESKWQIFLKAYESN